MCLQHVDRARVLRDLFYRFLISVRILLVSSVQVPYYTYFVGLFSIGSLLHVFCCCCCFFYRFLITRILLLFFLQVTYFVRILLIFFLQVLRRSLLYRFPTSVRIFNRYSSLCITSYFYVAGIGPPWPFLVAVVVVVVGDVVVVVVLYVLC